MCIFSVMSLILTPVCALMSLLSPTVRAADTFPLPQLTSDPVTELERLETPYLHLPMFLHFRKPRVDKHYFSPVQVNRREPLPERVRQVLVPAPRPRLKRVRPSGPVRVTCNAKMMRVRVHTGAGQERVHVRLGTCIVNKRTAQFVIFQYELHECDTQRQIINHTLVYSNMLHYSLDANVSGSETFSVPVQCLFNRFYYSYKIGFVPSVERVKFFKPMKTKGSVTLTACDAQWNRLSSTEAFVIGQPMYFEAEILTVPDNERLFVHFCHVTTNSSRVSTPQVKIVDNYGCLMDSKRSTKSGFIRSNRRNVVRFTIDAFTLQGKVQKHLFIHCEMSIRSNIPTPMSKSCTYNHQEHRWEELYGTHTVCLCCDSSCVPEMPPMKRPLKSELKAIVEELPVGKSRKNPTPSTEGISTLEPEDEDGIIILGRMPMGGSKHAALTPKSELAEFIPESTTMLDRVQGILLPGETLLPDGEQGIPPTHETLLPDSTQGILLTHKELLPDGEQGIPPTHQTLLPYSEEGIPLPPETLLPDGEQGIPPPEETLLPYSEQSIPPPEETLLPDGEQGIPPPEETLLPYSEQSIPPPEETLLPDGEQGIPPPEETLLPDGEQSIPPPEETLLPYSEQSIPPPEETLLPYSEQSIPPPEETLLPDGEQGIPPPEETLLPYSEQSKPSTEETLLPDGEQSIPPPEETLLPDGEQGIPPPEETLLADGEQGIQLPHQTLPPDSGQVTSEHRAADNENETPIPDVDQENITPYPHAPVSPSTFTPSVEQHTITPVHKRTDLHEPYRNFEEVFGLS